MGRRIRAASRRTGFLTCPRTPDRAAAIAGYRPVWPVGQVRKPVLRALTKGRSQCDSRSALLVLFLAAPAFADWKPAPAPLMTKWGKEVTPENAWQEYPRPQLVRKDWQNLNGLWDYAITAKDAAKPDEVGRADPRAVLRRVGALSGVGKHSRRIRTLWYRRDGRGARRLEGQARAAPLRGGATGRRRCSSTARNSARTRGMSDPFSFDITDALKDGKNELVVRVWDPTDDGQPAARQAGRASPAASGTRRSPASGRRCGWSRCRDAHDQVGRSSHRTSTRAKSTFVVEVVARSRATSARR